MIILVTGSAGYIGSHACLTLLEDGHQVVGVDNYSRGNRGATAVLEKFNQFLFVESDIRNRSGIIDILIENKIEAVMHFAAYAYVGESWHSPLKYYDNNVGGSLSLLQAIGEAGVAKLVFSSTCATYGQPAADQIPINENCLQKPINPYGRSKLMAEQAINDFADSPEAPENFSFVILRYFNVAGADSHGRLGEVHRPETHLIPLCLQAALGQKAIIDILGTDYPTNDGTCIRDYIHVTDLIDAHTDSLAMLGPGEKRVYNIGTGAGYSVAEVIAATKSVTHSDFETRVAARRPGDPPVLCADASRIHKEIGWAPRRGELEAILTDAWRWIEAHPVGFD